MSGKEEFDGFYIVDAHQHFQDLEQNYYPWLCDKDAPEKLEGDLTAIRKTYLPAEYRQEIAGYTVRKTVHVQNGWDPRDPLGETKWLHDLASSAGLPDAIVAYADLAAPGVDELLAGHAAYPLVRGIRQILNWDEIALYRVALRPDLMNDVAWRRGFALLAKHNFSFDLQIYWQQMEMAFALGSDFPETQLVLDHFGMPVDRSAEGIDHWSSAMERLARAPNVAVKLSGFGLGHPRWSLEDTVPLLTRTIDLFGSARVMVGTNLPVDRLFSNSTQVFDALAAAISSLEPTQKKAVLSGNAERIYKI
jgi:predicted TIM-barrel fold metal-dependent hydrolase